MDFDKIIEYALQNQISDIHMVTGKPIFMRQNGKMQSVGQPLSDSFNEKLVAGILNETQKQALTKKRHIDFMHSSGNGTRLRGNAFYTNTGLSICFRLIMSTPPNFADLGFPQFVGEELLRAKQGLVLVVGPTGQGKSTTIGSVLKARADNFSEHMLMIEDPIEYIIDSGKGIVQQREVGRDVETYSEGIMGSLREDPDVLMIGEIRDKPTIQAILTLAETGHLVFSTLHTNGAVQTINRILDSFTVEERPQIRAQLATNLSMIISQRLIPKPDGNGRVLAFEILTMNYAVANYIRQDKVFQIPNVMQTDSSGHMILFEQSLVALVMSNRISKETAIEYATDKNQLQALFELNNID